MGEDGDMPPDFEVTLLEVLENQQGQKHMRALWEASDRGEERDPGQIRLPDYLT
jgi:hypothetical protein